MKKLIVLLLALGLVIGLVGCAADTPEPEIATTTTTTEETTTTTQAITVDYSLPYEIVLYLPSVCFETHAGGELYIATIQSRTDGTAEHIVALLIEHGALRQNSQALSFDGTTLDMNEGFLQQMGSSGEGQTLTSLVRTFLTFYELEYIYLTANGEIIDTGHNAYDWPLTYHWYTWFD